MFKNQILIKMKETLLYKRIMSHRGDITKKVIDIT